MMNVLKIVFLGVLGFGILVYLTAPEQENSSSNLEVKNNKITVQTLPNFFEIIGSNTYTRKNDLFKKDAKKYIIVLNHDALSLVEPLKTIKRNDIVLVANISKTPWFIKKLAVNGKLAELNKDSSVPMINDTSGELIKALKIFDDTQTKYFILKINEDSTITKIHELEVKKGALEFGISKEESTLYLSSLLASLN
jgi:hypothetical protein